MRISLLPSAPQHDLREKLTELLTLRAKVAQLERAAANGGAKPAPKIQDADQSPIHAESRRVPKAGGLASAGRRRMGTARKADGGLNPLPRG
jgi:hypothetical protein